VDAFFTAPGAPVNPTDRASAPLTPPADPRQAEIAAKAAAEKAKIETDAAHQKMKLEAQLAFEREKFALEKELKLLDLQIARERNPLPRRSAADQVRPARPCLRSIRCCGRSSS
jgi:hypothetical protein